MTKLSNYGVPITPGKKVMLPIASHKFKLGNCHSEITQNVVNVVFDFAKKTLTVDLRVTVDPMSFEAAMRFAHVSKFSVDMMTGMDDSYYSIHPEGLKLVEHDLRFDYATSQPALHKYKWTYTNVDIVVPNGNDEMLTPPEGFLTPAQAVELAREKKKSPVEDDGFITQSKDIG